MTKEQALKKIEELKEFINQSEDLFNIKTYSEVCKRLGEKEKDSSYEKIKQIEKLFNGSWEKDWTNKNQYKWYPYYEVLGGGSVRFCASHSCYYGFGGVVALYKDQKTSDYVGKIFINIYKELM